MLHGPLQSCCRATNWVAASWDCPIWNQKLEPNLCLRPQTLPKPRTGSVVPTWAAAQASSHRPARPAPHCWDVAMNNYFHQRSNMFSFSQIWREERELQEIKQKTPNPQPIKRRRRLLSPPQGSRDTNHNSAWMPTSPALRSEGKEVRYSGVWRAKPKLPAKYRCQTSHSLSIFVKQIETGL